jgi:hypothetical protein
MRPEPGNCLQDSWYPPSNAHAYRLYVVKELALRRLHQTKFCFQQDQDSDMLLKSLSITWLFAAACLLFS